MSLITVECATRIIPDTEFCRAPRHGMKLEWVRLYPIKLRLKALLNAIT